MALPDDCYRARQLSAKPLCIKVVMLYCLKFQIDKYQIDDTDTANQVNHFQTCSCKGVEIM